ncbi:unnamed protein product [Lasius platythorax]|uniref:Uncharacterized protein n=1 Tax=Lasius platythorax TaxID=488582 RepID=A0AAV2N540_9HYME
MRVVVVATAMAGSARDDVKRSRTVSMLLSLSMINGKTFLLVFLRATAENCADTWVHLRCAILNDERRSVARLDVGSVEVDLQLRGRRYKTIQDNKETGKY